MYAEFAEIGTGMLTRCGWAGISDPLYIAYHDHEWGVPEHDDRKLFEMLVLEGAQAGLSWLTILRKRLNFRQAFDAFEPAKVAQYDSEKIAELMNNPGIIRNKAKINAAITNARAFVDVQREFGSFDTYIWQFVRGKPIRNDWQNWRDVPAETDESRAMSKALRKRGFKFVGPIVCYSFMQACGLVNDHTVDCFRYEQVANLNFL
jgi:DNA-3-methyladenine glycosylase I